jgi:hypothetical protein
VTPSIVSIYDEELVVQFTSYASRSDFAVFGDSIVFSFILKLEALVSGATKERNSMELEACFLLICVVIN